MISQNPFTQDSRQKKLQSPDQIGSTLKVTALPTYLLVLTALLLIGAFFVWGFLGTVSDKVYYSGVVFPLEGTSDVSLPNRGMVRTIFVHSGDHVSRGQSVALISVDNSYSILTSTVEGTVISTKVDNEPFEAFEPIISVISGNEAQTQRTMLIAYIDNAGQRDLREGMGAQVWPEDEKRDEIGYVRGRVMRIDRYPVSANEVRQTLKNEEMASRLLESGHMMYQVNIELMRSEQNPTLYDWSFGQPDDVSMNVGTYCSVLSETRRRSMFQYLFEGARTWFRAIKLRAE
jgi:biotin carboxyl carrier protein